jgi:endonuclease YncB( thermonuclease family)
MNYLKLLFLTALLILPSISSAETIKGRVVSVADGDTITVLNPERKQLEIRLAAVDTPEKKQAYGQKAKDFTAARVAGKNVTIKPETIDKYGRTVGFVFVDGSSKSINEQIVAEGHGFIGNIAREHFALIGYSWKKSKGSQNRSLG